jgi:hypothetical protein
MTYDFETVEAAVGADGDLEPGDYVRLATLSEAGYEIKAVAVAAAGKFHTIYLQRPRPD